MAIAFADYGLLPKQQGARHLQHATAVKPGSCRKVVGRTGALDGLHPEA
jgi:hypothetical protein